MNNMQAAPFPRFIRVGSHTINLDNPPSCLMSESTLTRGMFGGHIVLNELTLSNLRNQTPDFSQSIFTVCRFDPFPWFHLNLSLAVFLYCDLEKADFRGANLAGTTFVNCNLSGAQFLAAATTQTVFLENHGDFTIE